MMSRRRGADELELELDELELELDELELDFELGLDAVHLCDLVFELRNFLQAGHCCRPTRLSKASATTVPEWSLRMWAEMPAMPSFETRQLGRGQMTWSSW